MSTVKVVVTNSDIAGHPVSDIRLDERIAALPLEVRRQRTQLPLSNDLELHCGDVVTMYGPEFAIQRHVGHVERDVVETDLFTFSLGIAAGIGLGTVAVTVAGILH
jgi:putative transport protein